MFGLLEHLMFTLGPHSVGGFSADQASYWTERFDWLHEQMCQLDYEADRHDVITRVDLRGNTRPLLDQEAKRKLAAARNYAQQQSHDMHKRTNPS